MTDWLLRYRLWLLGAAALFNAALDSVGPPRDSDFFLFADVADVLFSARWAHALDDPFIQLGPLGLLWPAANALISEVSELAGRAVFSATVYLGVTFGAVALVRLLYRHRGEETPPWIESWAGLAVIVSGVGWAAISSGQPFDAVVAVLWVMVASAAVRGRGLLAALLLGAACAVKLQAILGFPLLLLLPGLRRRTASVAVAALVATACYLPFFVWGDGGTFAFEWRVSDNSFISNFVGVGTAFTWEMRALQTAGVLILGAAVVFVLRGSPHVVWGAPFALSVLRVVSDPLSFAYYWLGAEMVAVGGIALLLRDAGVAVRVALTLGYVAFGLATLVPGGGNPARLVLALALFAYLFSRLDRGPGFVEEAHAPV